MRMRRQLLAAMLAGLMALAGTACQVEEFEGDPLQEEAPVEDGFQDPSSTGDDTLYGDS